jgi:NAD kinase
MLPRCVIVERPTEYRELLEHHATREQARFFLEQRGVAIEDVEARHRAFEAARSVVAGAIPADWRTAAVSRDELDRFLFAADDIVVAVGQDGLVANIAKYLDGQPVIGVDPEPGRNPGVLVRQAPEAVADLLADVAAGRAALEGRTMVQASLDDGQRLVALNEVFVGHASHQSARYALTVAGRTERQSSSGLIVATGTGATGWAASINRERRDGLALPAPTDRELAWFVREAWPSPATGTALTAGVLEPTGAVTVRCELGDGGKVFGDGIESDALRPSWGQMVTIERARPSLALVR